MVNFATARQNMVENQIRTNKVTDLALLGALLNLPRELFVPEDRKGVAYVDEDIAIGSGRYLTEPMVLARLIQTAAVKPTDVVLVIGCGSGYSAALLGRMAARVEAVESDRGLAGQAAQHMANLGLGNAKVHVGELAKGWPAGAPYDVIVFDGAVADAPEAVIDQLAEGGRLAAVVAGEGVGRATLMERAGGIVSRRVVFDASTPLLPGFAPEQKFVF
jgi:protein-L-isoaspartate(D-aspartate) O-methyltransferase